VISDAAVSIVVTASGKGVTIYASAPPAGSWKQIAHAQISEPLRRILPRVTADCIAKMIVRSGTELEQTQRRKATRLMRAVIVWSHVMQNDGDARFSDLPSGFRSSQARAPIIWTGFCSSARGVTVEGRELTQQH